MYFRWRLVSSVYFRVLKAIFDQTAQGALSTTHLMGAGAGKSERARLQDSNTAKGNTQDMEATSANLLTSECQSCSEARRPCRPAPRFPSSGAMVSSQLWIKQTPGGLVKDPSASASACLNLISPRALLEPTDQRGIAFSRHTKHRVG